MTKVSVVVPIFNAGKKLNKCINSILNQSFTEIELILVNDGSTDNSLPICKKYEKKDKRIVLVDKKNEGCIAARRNGVEVSKTPYVMFVDADDWIHKDMIKILYQESLEHDLDISICNIYKAAGNLFVLKKEGNTRYFNDNKLYQKEEIINDLVVAYFHGHPFPASLFAKLYRKEFLQKSGKYLERISFLGEDLFYNMEIFLKVNKVKLINRPLYFYRAGGLTSKYMAYLFDDMVNGYHIQKEVINEFYYDSRETHHCGISIMLLNTFKTCLFNLFNSDMDMQEKKSAIIRYLSNEAIRECIENKGAITYFPQEYLIAIQDGNIDFLYNLGKSIYEKKKPRMLLLKAAAKAQLL